MAYRFFASYMILNFVCTDAGLPLSGFTCRKSPTDHSTWSHASSLMSPSMCGGGPTSILVVYILSESFCEYTAHGMINRKMTRLRIDQSAAGRGSPVTGLRE